MAVELQIILNLLLQQHVSDTNLTWKVSKVRPIRYIKLQSVCFNDTCIIHIGVYVLYLLTLKLVVLLNLFRL
jgi:hypothetical protein